MRNATVKSTIAFKQLLLFLVGLMMGGTSPRASEIYSTINECSIRPATLCADMNLEHANLHGANLARADLSRATLNGADLRAAKLDRANMQRTFVLRKCKIITSSLLPPDILSNRRSAGEPGNG